MTESSYKHLEQYLSSVDLSLLNVGKFIQIRALCQKISAYCKTWSCQGFIGVFSTEKIFEQSIMFLSFSYLTKSIVLYCK